MTLQTLATTLAVAERGGYAVGAFNVSDLNQSRRAQQLRGHQRARRSVTPSYGIDAAQKQAGIAQGIRKINQGTDSQLAWTAALRTELTKGPAEVEPSSAIAAAMVAMTQLVRERMCEFGSAGQAR
jgi:fructose/tagatose bisphosphate aldolase